MGGDVVLFDNIRELIGNYKKPIYIVIAVIVFIGLISLVLSYKIVVFNVSDSKDMTIEGYSLNSISSNVATPIELSAGFNIVAKNINYFEISQPDKGQIIAEHSQPFYSVYQSFDISLQPQKQLTKTYTGPYSCFTGTKNAMYSYSCTNPNYIYNYVTNKTPWRNEPTSDVSGQRSLVPYKNGLLGIRHINGLRYDDPLVYTDAINGKKTTYNIPSELTSEEIGTASLTPSDTNEDIILLASTQSDSFYVLNIANNSIVNKIAYPEDHSQEDGVACQVVQNLATCFIGKSLHSIDKEVDDDRESRESSIYTFELTSSETVTKQSVNSDLYIRSIYTSASGNNYAITDSGLLVKLDESGGAVVVSRNVQSVTVADQLYFSRDSNLYILDEDNLVSNLAFETTGNISSVRTFQGDAYMSMLAVDSKGQTLPNSYTFKITNKDITDNKAWTILELAKNEYVRTIDFNDEKISITPWTTNSANQRQQITKSIGSDIQKLPIDTSNYGIVYNF